MTTWTAVTFPGAWFSLAELRAATLDGHIRPLGLGFVAADAPNLVWLRARSTLPVVGDQCAAVGITAAWIHGALAGDMPFPVFVQRAVPWHISRVLHRGVRYFDRALPDQDAQTLGGVIVSTPPRTLADAARDWVSGSPTSHISSRAARVLAADAPTRRAALDWYARNPGRPHAGAAATALLELADAGKGADEREGRDQALVAR